MSTRKPLPQIAPCPCPKHCKATVVRIGDGYYCRVISSCGFAGPIERANRASILSWNRRSDAETKLRSVAKGWEDRSVAQEKVIDRLIEERDEAERRGALAADLYVGAPLRLKGDNGRWFKASIGFPVEMTATDGTHNYPLRLDQEGDQWCFGCGEVLPAKTKKGARKQ